MKGQIESRLYLSDGTHSRLLQVRSWHGHLFLLAKGQGAGGADEAGGPDGAAGADQPGEGGAGCGRRGGGLGRGLGHDLLRVRDEVLDLAPDLRLQVLGLGLALGEERLDLGGNSIKKFS